MGRNKRVGIRWLLTVLLFTALGLSTSVAVAWGATVYYVGLSSEIVSVSVRQTVLGRDDEDADVLQSLRRRAYSFELSAGWPRHCLRYSERSPNGRHNFASSYDGEIYGFLDMKRLNRAKEWIDIQYLPRGPIYSGLMINVMFWGFIWFILFNCGNVRRLQRWLQWMRKKRCAWCEYDLRQLASAVCPECGHATDSCPVLLSGTRRLVALFVLLILVSVEVAFLTHFLANRQAEPIHRAAVQGELEVVKDELGRGAEIDLAMPYFPYENYTPLIFATSGGHTELVDYLVACGADVTAVTDRDGNALSVAIHHGHLELARHLIDIGVPVNLRTGDSSEPLMSAIQFGYVETVRMLIEAGADVNMRDAFGYAPLHRATDSRGTPAERAELIRILLAAGSNPDQSQNSSFRSPLAEVIGRQELDMARVLLDAGANASDITALEAAAGQSHIVALEVLISYGADLSTTAPGFGLSLLWYVNRNPYDDVPRIWKQLVEGGADVNTVLKRNGRSLLIDAVQYDQTTFATFLLEHGADPTIVDNAGRRAADYIVSSAHESELKALLDEYETNWIAVHGDSE